MSSFYENFQKLQQQKQANAFNRYATQSYVPPGKEYLRALPQAIYGNNLPKMDLNKGFLQQAMDNVTTRLPEIKLTTIHPAQQANYNDFNEYTAAQRQFSDSMSRYDFSNPASLKDYIGITADGRLYDKATNTLFNDMQAKIFKDNLAANNIGIKDGNFEAINQFKSAYDDYISPALSLANAGFSIYNTIQANKARNEQLDMMREDLNMRRQHFQDQQEELARFRKARENVSRHYATH